ncbi:hypothetical protein PQR53_07810 [Paraburkholderia fungorum]|uniref:hypothetical protein n=1 Tax=Paraburkholderia fungorum TaxID=134537 RepID=UPI0038BA3A3C
MSFNPAMYQPTDTDWMLSKWAYNRLCYTSAQVGLSRPATARRMLNSFLKLAKSVDYDLSRLKFDIANEALDIPVSFGVIFRDGEVERVCRAGRFAPDSLLEVAISLRGLKEEAVCHEHN